MKETFKQADYTYYKKGIENEHFLKNEDGEIEVWFNNKNHPSYGLIYKNTHLEFARSPKKGELV